MKTTISSINDIEKLVDCFYEKIRQDELLGPIFDNVIKNNWDVHLQKMYSFWETVLLKEHTYNGTPFLPHSKLPIGEKHFSRWLELFEKTLLEHFEGVIAEEAKWRAHKMAEMFQAKIEYHHQNNSKPLL